jgi:hypothetical protein
MLPLSVGVDVVGLGLGVLVVLVGFGLAVEPEDGAPVGVVVAPGPVVGAVVWLPVGVVEGWPGVVGVDGGVLVLGVGVAASRPGVGGVPLAVTGSVDAVM